MFFISRELIDINQTEFEVRDDELNCDREETNYFKFEELEPFINNDCIGLNNDDNRDDLSPFQILKCKMFKVDDAGKIMKKVSTI